MDKNKIKNISLIILAIGLIVSICDIFYLNNKYSSNEIKYKNESDSLCTVISSQAQTFDSLKIINDSLYQYELTRNDSLYEVIKTNQKNNKTKITYIYKDSTIIKEAENSELTTNTEIKYVDKIVEKEVIKTIHDTIQVTKTDTLFQENTTVTKKTEEETKKEVVVKDDLFNMYLDGNIKGNLDFDIVPEVNIGVILKERYYGELGIDYNNGKVNPNAKLGIRFNFF